jgi:hypothetical protein
VTTAAPATLPLPAPLAGRPWTDVLTGAAVGTRDAVALHTLPPGPVALLHTNGCPPGRLGPTTCGARAGTNGPSSAGW